MPVELTAEENWWSNGPTGPCGPDSRSSCGPATGRRPGTPGTDGRWVEVWNHVMMRYRRHEDGSLIRCASPVSTPAWAWNGC